MKISEQLKTLFLENKKDFDEIIGQGEIKKQVKSALIANRHMLIVGPPGTGKTTLAKNISLLLPEIEVMNCEFNCLPDNPVCPSCKARTTNGTKKIDGASRFVRIQGSPDLTAEDLIGDIDPAKALKHGALSLDAFTPGKIFKANNGVLFFDEINRCPEKLQNALLQVLQERIATIGSYTVDLEANFVFIATMNPEDSSTEVLSDVLLDRFDVAYMEYPEKIENEIEIVLSRGKHLLDFPPNVLHGAVLFVRLLRESDKLDKVPSVRAAIGLYERAQSNALLEGKEKVDFRDVNDAIFSVISHRIKLKPSAQYLQTPQEFIKEQLKKFSEQQGIDAESGDVP